MASNWSTYKLEDVADIGSSKRIKMADYVSEGVPFYRSKEIIEKNKGNEISTELFITEEQFNAIEEKFGAPKELDILLTSVGTLGVPYQVQKDEKFYFKDGNLTWLRNFKDFVNPRYIYFWLTSTIAKRKIDEVTIGSTQQALTIVALKSLTIDLPPLKVQNVVVQHLEALTGKITLNRQTNQTLEQMVQALFKSWFVDFDPVIDNALAAGNDIPEALQHKAEQRKQAQQLPDFKPLPDDIRVLFPSEFEQTDEPSIGIAGWIPKGWKKTSFESLIKLIGGGTPKTSIDEYWNGDIPWFSVVDAPNDSDVFVLDTEKHVTKLGVDKSSTKILRTGTTIISARGTVGKCALVGEPMAMNQSCYGINGNEGIADTFIYFLTRYQVSDLQKRGHGSVFNTITRETFKSINLAFSGGELTLAFERLVTPYLEKILLNNRQVTELAKTRDALLPKLISGELAVNKDVA